MTPLANLQLSAYDRISGTHTLPLRGFTDIDLTRVYVVIEFVFEAASPRQRVHFRNVRFLCRS